MEKYTHTHTILVAIYEPELAVQCNILVSFFVLIDEKSLKKEIWKKNVFVYECCP